jgi:hypothetical protein
MKFPVFRPLLQSVARNKLENGRSALRNRGKPLKIDKKAINVPDFDITALIKYGKQPFTLTFLFVGVKFSLTLKVKGLDTHKKDTNSYPHTSV